jgi:hypothetical protein
MSDDSDFENLDRFLGQFFQGIFGSAPSSSQGPYEHTFASTEHPNCMSHAHIVIMEVWPQPKDLKCDRCFNRQPNTMKRFPADPKTLCDECKQKMKFLDYVTSEA